MNKKCALSKISYSYAETCANYQKGADAKTGKSD